MPVAASTIAAAGRAGPVGVQRSQRPDEQLDACIPAQPALCAVPCSSTPGRPVLPTAVSPWRLQRTVATPVAAEHLLSRRNVTGPLSPLPALLLPPQPAVHVCRDHGDERDDGRAGGLHL